MYYILPVTYSMLSVGLVPLKFNQILFPMFLSYLLFARGQTVVVSLPVAVIKPLWFLFLLQ